MDKRLAWMCVGVVASATTMLGVSSSAAFAEMNGRIAYQCGSAICSINPDGTGELTLPASGSEPSYSPDGSLIIYSGGGGISEMKPDGSDQQSLVPGGTMPSFSWSGAEFAYETAPGVNESINFWSLSAGFESAIQPGGAIYYPQMFPSGTEVLWGNGTFYTADRNGTGVNRVNVGSLSVSNPAITPSGQVLAVGGDDQIHR